jgi:hypothetical protein
MGLQNVISIGRVVSEVKKSEIHDLSMWQFNELYAKGTLKQRNSSTIKGKRL